MLASKTRRVIRHGLHSWLATIIISQILCDLFFAVVFFIYLSYLSIVEAPDFRADRFFDIYEVFVVSMAALAFLYSIIFGIPLLIFVRKHGYTKTLHYSIYGFITGITCVLLAMFSFLPLYFIYYLSKELVIPSVFIFAIGSSIACHYIAKRAKPGMVAVDLAKKAQSQRHLKVVAILATLGIALFVLMTMQLAQKPHMEQCVRWVYEGDQFAAKNICDEAVFIRFEKEGLAVDRQLNPGETLLAGLKHPPWMFTVCPVGYVSSVPFEGENNKAIRASRYSCVRKWRAGCQRK